ncbi:MAG: SpoIIE family protein phosphatase, partial [Hyphomicrobiales bacterium]
VGRTIAFVGAKGGAGASSVAHNVAWAISKSLGQNTAIVDLDLPFGTAGLDFNQDPTQGVADIVFAPDRADAAVVDRLLARCTEQLSLLAAPATLDRTYDVDDSAFDNAIDILRAQVPYVVLDVPHGWSGWTRRVLNSADEVVIVSPPDLASLRNTKNLFDLLRAARINDTPPRLILNGVGLPKRPEIKPGELLCLLNRYAHLTLAPHSVYLTALCMQIDTERDELIYASGGHPPAFIIRADGALEELFSTTFVLGACGGDDFEDGAAHVPFLPGDRLLAYTDGITETLGSNGRLLGLEGLRAIMRDVSMRRGPLADAVLAATDAKRVGARADDTLVEELRRSELFVAYAIHQHASERVGQPVVMPA